MSGGIGIPTCSDGRQDWFRIKEFCDGREWRETKQRFFLTGREAKAGCTLALKNNFSVKYILNVHFFLKGKYNGKTPEKQKY